MQRKEIADIFFISPVYPSNSHPWSGSFKKLYFSLSVLFVKKKDIYALGGMNDKNFKFKNSSSILGYGGISDLRSDMTEYNPKKLKKMATNMGE